MTSPTLTAPFKNTEELSKGGRKFTYVPTPEVIERLNACLGYGGWSYEVSEAFHHPQDDPAYVVAKGRLTALGAVWEQYGGQTVNKMKDGRPIDLADDYKGAASDALKKCAAFIGVGLYLSLKRGPTPNETSSGGDSSDDPHPAKTSGPPVAPAGEPSPPGESAPSTNGTGTTSGEGTGESGSLPVPDPLDRFTGIEGVNRRVKALTGTKRELWFERKPEPGPSFVAEALTVLDEIDAEKVTA